MKLNYRKSNDYADDVNAQIKECYNNSTKAYFAHFEEDKDLRYVEGHVWMPISQIKIPLEHGWLISGNEIIDPTLVLSTSEEKLADYEYESGRVFTREEMQAVWDAVMSGARVVTPYSLYGIPKPKKRRKVVTKNVWAQAAILKGYTTEALNADNLDEWLDLADRMQQGDWTSDAVDTLYRGLTAAAREAERNSAERRYLENALEDAEKARRELARQSEADLRGVGMGIYLSLSSLQQLIDAQRALRRLQRNWGSKSATKKRGWRLGDGRPPAIDTLTYNSFQNYVGDQISALAEAARSLPDVSVEAALSAQTLVLLGENLLKRPKDVERIQIAPARIQAMVNDARTIQEAWLQYSEAYAQLDQIFRKENF